MAFNKAKALQEAEKSLVQGKVDQAVKQYLQIFEKDPADLALLNTVGDLYVRQKNTSEALKHFHKLAESYTQEGFTVKAIAIYKKISKLDPAGVDVLLKMGELYTVQGLGREAREQYAAAVDYYKKKNLNDKALEAFRKLVALDPENAAYRAKLAEFCEQVGKKSEAAQVYVETAEVSLRRGDAAAAELALKKASSLDAKSPQVKLLQARLALSKGRPDEAEKILNSAPDLKSKPTGRQLLLEAYLAGHKLDAAEELVVDVFRANPADFSPLSSFAVLCMEKENYDAATDTLAKTADLQIEQKNAAPLVEVLRQIWAKNPQHIPTLELLYNVCEKTADEFSLPEILEALGNAHVQAGDLAKAEAAFQKLVAREPENEQYKALLKQVLRREGKEVAAASPADFSQVEMALSPEPETAEAPTPPAAASGEEAAMVKEALENSDLYTRYNLTEKAVAELEKVLLTYPDQVDIHKRILEVAQKGAPGRAAEAAAALARVYTQQGDLASAKKYEQMARKGGAAVTVGEAAQAAAGPARPPARKAPAAPPSAKAPSPPASAEIDLSADFPGSGFEQAPAPPSQEFPIDLGGASAGQATEAPAQEIDLSGMEGSTSPPVEGIPAPPQAPPFNFEESRVEIDYYLDQGFVEEANKAAQVLEERYPGDPQVAELRRRVEKHGTPQPQAGAPPAAAAGDEWEQPASSGESAPSPTVAEPPPPPEPPPRPPRPPQRAPVEAAPPPAAGGDLLGGLASELASTLEGIEGKGPPPSARGAQRPPSKGAPASASGGSPLSGLLEELGEGPEAQGSGDDPQTHYDLGVAFREMNLLDEAIGEFQKVVKGAQKDKTPPNFLQACTLLALCFMDKKMPAIATKWYLRALEMPNLEEEATLALLYDLGVAYEQAGDTRTALEKFSEVYSQNIDYRDVAEKIRLLQQKP